MGLIMTFMFILPIFQTWMIWNNVPLSGGMDDILYTVFIITLLYKIIKDKKYKELKLILNNKNLKKSMLLIGGFFATGIVITLIQMISRDDISVKGLVWELYKLSRNIFILIYVLLYIDEYEFYKYVKLYVYLCIFMVFILILQLIFGYDFYRMTNFLPNIQDYPDFYNYYIPQKRNVATFAHSNVLGEFLSFGYIIIFYAISTGKKIFKTSKYDMMYLIIILAGVFLSTSRMTLLLTIGITIFMIFRFNLEQGKQVIKKSILITIPFAIFGINKLVYKLWEYYYYGILQGSTEMRVQAWKQAIMMFRDYLFTGTGLGTWGDASASYSTFNYHNQLEGVVNNLSDSYLSHILVEHGIYTILLVLGIWFLYKAFKDSMNKSKYFSLISIHSIIFVSIASFKSMGLSIFEVSFFLFFIVGYSIKDVLKIDTK